MNRFCSLFSQLLQRFPRNEFHQAVKKTRAERHAPVFTCGGQFIAMLFCHLGRALRTGPGSFRRLPEDLTRFRNPASPLPDTPSPNEYAITCTLSPK